MKYFISLTLLLSFFPINPLFSLVLAAPLRHATDISSQDTLYGLTLTNHSHQRDLTISFLKGQTELELQNVSIFPQSFSGLFTNVERGESVLPDLAKRDNNTIQSNNTHLANPLTNLFDGAANAVSNAIQGATGRIASGVKALGSVAKTGLDAAKDFLNGGLRAATEVGRSVWDAITGQGTLLPLAGTMALSSTALASIAPFTQFARAAYCPNSRLKNWSCGEACHANPDFQVTLVGGDGDAIQQFFVGYSPSQRSIVVAHQGTDPTKFLADLTDLDILLDTLNPTLFPGTTASLKVHQGFKNEQAKTAHQILAEVKRLMSAKSTNNVTVIGHSLGGALAELDSLYLALNLPKAALVKAVTYGTPRVGNPEFAKFLDDKIPNLVRVNNKRDIVPIVPGQSFGYLHPRGEVHLLSPGNAVVCPGDDDSRDAQCTDKSVPSILAGNIFDHLGPYEGVYLGTAYCT